MEGTLVPTTAATLLRACPCSCPEDSKLSTDAFLVGKPLGRRMTHPKSPKGGQLAPPPRLTGASRGAFPPPPEGTLCCGVPSRSPSTPAGARPPCRPFAVLPTEIKSSHPLSCPRGPNSLKEGGLPFPLPPSCHLLPHKDGSVASSSWTSGDMSTGLEPLTLCTERRQDDVLREPPPQPAGDGGSVE